MKILFIIPGLAVGGQEKIGMMLTRELMKYHEVTTVCFEPPNPAEYKFETPIIRVVHRIHANPLLKLSNIFKRVVELRKIKRRYKPDVSISFGETAILANAFTFTSETKIASLHQSVKFLKLYRPLYRRAYLLHDKIVPVSSGINKELKDIYGISNSLFINNGYDIEAIKIAAKEPVDDKVSAFFNNSTIAHLGRFSLPKGHWHLAHVFVSLKKKKPDAKLLLIGSREQEGSAIYDFCLKLFEDNRFVIAHLDDATSDFANADILLTGHQSNPFKYLAKAKLFVFPSIWEGFGNALIEAMAVGLPVIAADCPTGPREIIGYKSNSEGNYGMLMPPFNLDFANIEDTAVKLHQQWAQTILLLLENRSEMEYFQKQSLKRCMDFTIKKSAEEWQKLISK